MRTNAPDRGHDDAGDKRHVNVVELRADAAGVVGAFDRLAAVAAAPGGAGRALWELGHVGWYQEHCIARNVQRQRGEHGDATHPKLASILPQADSWFDPAVVPPAQRGSVPLRDPQTIRQYLVDSLETTLELLDGAADHDDALYFYRLALLHEDAAVERFAELAQSTGFDTGLLAPLPTRALRAPLLFNATRWRLGSEPGGLVPGDEKWAHEVALPEFEIDAQPVSWAQYGEFVEDGGYDDRRHWSEPGWDWVQMRGRRTPRHVAQMRQGVLQRRFGQLVRVPLTHPALHLSWFEADAWCRWAGRRLPSEAEWEAAAIGLPVADAPNPWAGSANECLAKGIALHDEYRDDPLITTAMAPDFDASGDETLLRVRRAADELELPVTIRLIEARNLGSLGRKQVLGRVERLGLEPAQPDRERELVLLRVPLIDVHHAVIAEAVSEHHRFCNHPINTGGDGRLQEIRCAGGAKHVRLFHVRGAKQGVRRDRRQ